MAKNQTAQKNVKQPAAEVTKAPTKMDQAKALYDAVFAEGYDLNGASQRQVFIARAQSEIGLTSAGANTYFQNISNLKRGKGLYRYNSSTSKNDPARAADASGELPGQADKAKPTTRAKAKAAEAMAAVGVDLTKRFQIQNAKGEAVNSFGTKAAADKYAAAGKKLSVVDTKAAKAEK